MEAAEDDHLPPLPTNSQPLGFPMPKDEHACSVSLPTWSSVVGYEEGSPAVVGAMLCGYPRFVYHPYVLQLMSTVVARHGDKEGDGIPEDCLLLPTQEAAARCQVFLQQAWEGQRGVSASVQMSQHLPDNAMITANDDDAAVALPHSRVRQVEVVPKKVYAVLFPAETEAAMAAKAYWQHTGEVVSSRRAYHALQEMGVALEKTVTEEEHVCHHAHLVPGGGKEESPQQSKQQQQQPCDDSLVQYQLRERIAQWANVESPTSVFLTPSGMAAIYLALRSARSRHMALHGARARGGTSIVFGFPYLDTLKLCSRPEFCPAGVEFFGKGNAQDMVNLEALLEAKPNAISVLFTELPSNPLLHCPDIFKLRELATKYNFVLAVDDTISNFLNVDLIQSGLADVVCTSLTKLVSGRGDAIAGSCVVNPNTPAGQWIQADLESRKSQGVGQSGLFCPDAAAVLNNSVDFAERNDVINKTSEIIADWLSEHPDVERVYYPKQSDSVSLYNKVQKPKSGYGGLMSIILHPHVCQRTFYDALDVAKGPSLGTNFTLVCPYTLLAHYHELDFAMSYNVPPNLLRIAVGLEPAEDLKAKFDSAFAVSRLYPKPTTNQAR